MLLYKINFLEKEIKKVVSNLKMGKIVLMPTDTIWGITCDATNEFSVDRVFKLKKRDKLKSLIHLVPNITSLEKIVGPLSNNIKKIIKNSLKPTTIVYKNYQNSIGNIKLKDNTIAIRVVKDKRCKKIISLLGKPIIATSANVSGEKNPNDFDEISQKIIDGVDFVTKMKNKNKFNQPSRIISIDENEKILEHRS